MSLSRRGTAYAQDALLAKYELKEQRKAYNKTECPDGWVDFSNAENRFAANGILIHFINNHTPFDPKLCRYYQGSRGTQRLRITMANFLNNRFHPHSPVNVAEITFAAGVTPLTETLTAILTNPGEGILVGRPIYGSFKTDITTTTESHLVYTSFSTTDQFSPSCISAYEARLLASKEEGIPIRALLICNPHNPLGECYPRETLIALLQFCAKYSIHLISDEIYALSIFDPDARKTPFTSILSIDLQEIISPDLVHVLYGTSKDFAAPGLRIGCLISRNTQIIRATESLARFHPPSNFSDAIVAEILEDAAFVDEFLRRSNEGLREMYFLVRNMLDEAGIDYYRRGNAGFFLWVDLSPYLDLEAVGGDGWETERQLAKEITDARVDLARGESYGSETPGWFRVIFSVERDMVIEGVKRYVMGYFIGDTKSLTDLLRDLGLSTRLNETNAISAAI
ncbi:MAG: hypothetical protein M1820_010306 [Bogoriella megaspora]|nr:MAG: hypothetical protein M1820_010306 [Bogoriella megaspora]